jgi:uncharacterized repeat protein (TIGR04138 family)
MQKPVVPARSVEEVAAELENFALDAFFFVQQGVNATARKLHGPRTKKKPRHITGQELAEGLREIAVGQWGMLARTVLERWGITTTLDFGRIVYALIDAGLMSRTDEDSLDDFRNVYDFRSAFEKSYQIQPVNV